VKIGLVVDGETEFYALRPIVARLREASGNDILYPLRANISPEAPPGQIAQACDSRIKQLVLRGCDLVVVLVDREQRDDCCSVIATDLIAALSKRCACGLSVVVKDRMFENWAIADPGALSAQAARFDRRRVDQIARRVAPNKADRVDALRHLEAAAVSLSYDKVADGSRIMELADVLAIARNSRSFRRLLRVVEHPSYLDQSKSPA
jgi:hypothetical protein